MRIVMLAAVLVPSLVEAMPPSLDKAIARYEAAQQHGDKAALQQLLAQDYMLVTGGGRREGKDEFIGDLTDPTFKLEPYVIQAPLVRQWANGAVVAGIAREKGVAGKDAFDACIRYADTWKLADGAWQVVFTQVARADPPKAEGCKAP